MHDMVLNNRDTILHDLYLLNSPFAVDAFKPAISIILGEEHQTFKLKMLHNWISYDYKLEREDSTWGYAKTLSSSTQKQFTRISCLQKGLNDIQIQSVQAMDDSMIDKSPTRRYSRSSGGITPTQAVDADIGTKYEQSETHIIDTHLLETTIDSNTTPTSTNMCHRGGEIDQDALLNAELLKTKDMVCMEVYNELSKRFLQLEKHCISLEISIQQKEESFHSNKPCMNQDLPEFREFFVINDLKAQLQANITLICDLKKQIKSVKEASNEAKVKNDIDVIETINIELEHSVAKLLAANEQLHKENEHLKQTYKELFDSIKKTKVQNKDNSESLISQINQKFVENADLKAQLQEKVFANAALKNELRKIKGNSVDTKFAKASILGKPSLEPSRNHLVVRQPNAFTSERPRISRPRFASQVDEKNDLSKVRESAAAKPHQ
ncbi:hypothetical protein Tco_1129756, partial [Tanacetum coccineum]